MVLGSSLRQPASIAEQLLGTHLVGGPLRVTEKCDVVPALGVLRLGEGMEVHGAKNMGVINGICSDMALSFVSIKDKDVLEYMRCKWGLDENQDLAHECRESLGGNTVGRRIAREENLRKN